MTAVVKMTQQYLNQHTNRDAKIKKQLQYQWTICSDLEDAMRVFFPAGGQCMESGRAVVCVCWGASGSWRLSVCFENGGLLPPAIRTSSHPSVWISGTQISLSDRHTISVECRAPAKHGSHGPVPKRWTLYKQTLRFQKETPDERASTVYRAWIALINIKALPIEHLTGRKTSVY